MTEKIIFDNVFGKNNLCFKFTFYLIIKITKEQENQYKSIIYELIICENVIKLFKNSKSIEIVTLDFNKNLNSIICDLQVKYKMKISIQS